MAGGLDHSDDDAMLESHEINITPFIDVMLVLLIVFMVAAPLATVDVNVDLPASTAAPQARPTEPLFLTVKQDLTLALGDGRCPASSSERRSTAPPGRTARPASSCAPTRRSTTAI